MVRATWLWAMALGCLLAAPASAATGRVIKVLPQFMDRQGRTSLSPSLYERDAYQAELRLNPSRRSGLRYYVQWKTRGAVWQPLKLRVELRGVARGNLPKQLTLERKLAAKHTLFSRWDEVTLSTAQYQELETVTAWRVTLWEGASLLGEQKSFLW
ncbi:MAG TPA: hypothetical protein VJA21_17595 [Verrucomicrobiae bacterium]